jgi:hypothetical protein
MNTPVNRKAVQQLVFSLIQNGHDVEKVYDKVRAAYGDTAIKIVADCYFQMNEVEV